MARKPVIFETAGDSYSGGGIINSVIWVSPGSSAGDRVEIRYMDGHRLWECVTNSTNTYIGVTVLGMIEAEGIRCQRLDSGRIYIYFKEDF